MNTLLRTLLYEWGQRKLPLNHRQRYPHRHIAAKGTNNATVVTGFRRVGKTYLLYEAIEKLLVTHSREEVVYINFEDERIITPTTEMLTDLISEIQTVYGKNQNIYS